LEMREKPDIVQFDIHVNYSQYTDLRSFESKGQCFKMA